MSLFRYKPEIHDNPEFRHNQNGYDPNQPRVPKGHSDGGQWTRGGGGSDTPDETGTPRTRLAFLPALPPLVAAAAGGTGGATALETAGAIVLGLGVYSTLSRRNNRDQQTVIEFNAKQFTPDAKGQLDLKAVKTLTRPEVENACPGLQGVQGLTNDAAKAVRQEEERRKAKGEEPMSRSQYGTAVHSTLNQQVKQPNDPIHRAIVRAYDLRSEVSLLKGEEEDYGAKGSIRIDIMEKMKNNTVCVYDIKTGKSGLSLARMTEIATNVFKEFGAIQRIIVTEVRPIDGPRRLPR